MILYRASPKTLLKLRLNAAESYQTIDESQAVYAFQKISKNSKSVLEIKKKLIKITQMIVVN